VPARYENREVRMVPDCTKGLAAWGPSTLCAAWSAAWQAAAGRHRARPTGARRWAEGKARPSAAGAGDAGGLLLTAFMARPTACVGRKAEPLADDKAALPRQKKGAGP
jgi:hypothetical protein